MTRNRKPRMLILAAVMAGFMALAYMTFHTSDPTWAIMLAIYLAFSVVIVNVDVGGM